MGWTLPAAVVFRSVLATLANVCNVTKLLTWWCVEVEVRRPRELIPDEGVAGRDLPKVAGVLWGHGGALRIPPWGSQTQRHQMEMMRPDDET